MSTTETSPSDPDAAPGAPRAGRLLLIDGHSMAFRAYYALPVDSFTTSTGQATNAVHGFLSTLLSLLEQERPTHLAVAFDLPGGTFRTREYPDYKANRDETPQPLIGQIELIKDLLAAMGVRAVTAPDYEADDVLATLAARAQAEDLEVLVCSGDRDSFQLITENCTVLQPVRGGSAPRRMTPAQVQERYGVSPERYPHLAALVGETSDNLPGVPGVGPKTAAKWLNLYDGLDGVIAHAGQIRGRAGASLREHLDDVVRNRRLNRLVTDVDLGIDPLRDLRPSGARREELARIMEALELRSLHRRAQRVLTFRDDAGSDDGAPDPVRERLAALEIAVLGRQVEPGGVGAWLDRHVGGGPLGLDVVGVLAPERGDAQLLALSDGARALALDLALVDPDDERALAGYLCRPEQRGYDVAALARRWLDLDLEALDGAGDEGGAQGAFDLEALTDDAPPRALLACARRAAVLLPLYDVLRAQMVERGAEVLFTDLEMPVAALLAQMEDAGIAVDDAVLAERETELDARVTRAAEDAWAAAGHELNLSSPKQLQTVLFEELGMPKTRRTKTGYTTDAEALAGLYAKTSHPFLAGLLEHRDAIKLRQTVEGLRKAIGADGRIHTTFQQTIAATGRLSSTDPNLQNIPARTEEGRRIREAFVVGRGYECLLTADYSQIEMRIMAHLSGDEALIEAFRSGEDLHRYVAALVHDIDVEAVTDAQRSRIKAMSYGLAYGLSAFGLARRLGIDSAEAVALRQAYFDRFGKVHDYLEGVVERARVDGWTETILGRRRYLPDLTSDNRRLREMAERAALNAPIQGSAADIIKKAMIDVADALAGAGASSRVLLQIHDELLLEVAPGDADEVERIVRDKMGRAVELSVPLEVSVGRGATWREAAH